MHKLKHGFLRYAIVVCLMTSIIAPFRLMAGDADSVDITVYKSATCGCCSKWVEHLR